MAGLDLRAGLQELRMRIFPWSPPRWLRIALGLLGVVWALLMVWGAGVIMGARAFTGQLAGSLAANLALAVLLILQLPRASCKRCREAQA